MEGGDMPHKCAGGPAQPIPPCSQFLLCFPFDNVPHESQTSITTEQDKKSSPEPIYNTHARTYVLVFPHLLVIVAVCFPLLSSLLPPISSRNPDLGSHVRLFSLPLPVRFLG